MNKLFFSFIVFAFLSGCVSHNTTYYWGSYEQLLYDIYMAPGSADPLTQVEKLTTDISQAESKGKPVPPGVYAHLGMAYASLGNIGEAMAALTTEKTLYPESAVLIDGMIDRATASQGEN